MSGEFNQTPGRVSFQLEGIDHVALTVRNVELSARWYINMLGLERRFADVWGNMPAVVGAGTTSLALFPVTVVNPEAPPGPDTLCFRHVAFRVDRKNFDLVRDTLHASGIDTHFQDHMAAHSIYFRDPDGHQLEITTYQI